MTVLSDRLHVHVHLPEQQDGAVPRHEHVHLYLDLTAPGESSMELPIVGRPNRPALKAAAVIALFAVPASAGLMLARHWDPARAAAPIVPISAAASLPQPLPQTMPQALARELAQPPQITPPPGGAPAGNPPPGPASFGLH